MIAAFMAHWSCVCSSHPHNLMMTTDNLYTLINLFRNTRTQDQAANNSTLLMEPYMDSKAQ